MKRSVAAQSRAIDLSTEFYPLNEKVLGDFRRRMEGYPEPAVPTFLPTWNSLCQAEGGIGLGSGWFVIVAGHTGAGKTFLALNLTTAALAAGIDVLYVSLEMSFKQLVVRLRPIVTGKDIIHYERGNGYDSKMAKEADEAIAGLPGTVHVNQRSIANLGDVALLLEHFRKQGVRLAIVDYAQLLEVGTADKSLFDRMSAISSTLRFEAQRQGITVVAISQMNRATTRERKAPPTLDGLFGSSRLGQDADQVVALDYSSLRVQPMERRWTSKLLVLKNRHGPQGAIPIEFSSATFRMSEVTAEDGR